MLFVLGQPLQHLELADPQAVPLAKLAVQGRNDRCVAGGERAPRDHGLGDTPCRGSAPAGQSDTGLLLDHGHSLAPIQQ